LERKGINKLLEDKMGLDITELEKYLPSEETMQIEMLGSPLKKLQEALVAVDQNDKQSVINILIRTFTILNDVRYCLFKLTRKIDMLVADNDLKTGSK
jgi:hypothetical protein